MTTYRTFKRSCRNWQQFASARKITESTGLTAAQAIDECRRFNDNRTPAALRPRFAKAPRWSLQPNEMP